MNTISRDANLRTAHHHWETVFQPLWMPWRPERPEARMEIISGVGLVTMKEEGVTTFTGEVVSSSGGVLRTRVAYYPGWRVLVDGKDVNATPDGQGMISTTFSSGTHLITTYFSETPFGLLQMVYLCYVCFGYSVRLYLKNTMRIAIDTTPLESGHKDRGVGMYTKLLIEALQKYEGNHSYHFFYSGTKGTQKCRYCPLSLFRSVFYYPAGFPSTPRVVTVHDLIPLVFPEHFPAGIRGRLKWQVQRWSLGRTTRIITDSESSKRDIIRLAGISPQSIDVVPLAAAPAFRQISDKEVLKKVKKNYDLPEKFVLYVGDINWNKNILGMITAFERVRRSPRFRSGESGQAGSVKLVLVGSAFLDASLREVRQ